MTEKYQVSVYDENNKVVSRVYYNAVLDYWNGRNWENGGEGKHKGITKLRDGRYVLITGSDLQGERDYGVIISPEEALKEILKSGHAELLKNKKYKELKFLYKKYDR